MFVYKKSSCDVILLKIYQIKPRNGKSLSENMPKKKVFVLKFVNIFKNQEILSNRSKVWRHHFPTESKNSRCKKINWVRGFVGSEVLTKQTKIVLPLNRGNYGHSLVLTPFNSTQPQSRCYPIHRIRFGGRSIIRKLFHPSISVLFLVSMYLLSATAEHTFPLHHHNYRFALKFARLQCIANQNENHVAVVGRCWFKSLQS